MNTMPYTARGLRPIVFATSAGTVFEAYDFILFGTLTPLISAQFFSALNETAAFVFSLLTFAAGYLSRPLGALLFGSLGDRQGRKRAFVLTLTMMGLATFGIGLLPTYEQAGILAPILLISLRLLQGLSFGGEFGGALVYLGEHAPADRRAFYSSWIQAAAGFALFLAFFVMYVTRTVLGEEAFTEWGWRLPFLISLVLLVSALWVRWRLEESPLFRRLAAEGRTSKRPVSEVFSEWPYLRLVLVTLFGLILPQAVVFYMAHFYSQYFLIQILKLPEVTMGFLMMLVTLISVPLYLGCGMLADKVGRKPLQITGALLTLVITVPVFQQFTQAVNPALAEASIVAPVLLTSDSHECSLQFDPVGEADFTSSCDIAKNALTAMGVPYSNARGSPGTLAVIQVGDSVIQAPDGTMLSEAELAEIKRQFRSELQMLLEKEGYDLNASQDDDNLLLVGALLLALVLASTLLYVPASVTAIELFPTRIRYTGVSVPYHIGFGWFGGFLPAIAFAMVAANGSIYFGLWYPLAAVAIGTLVLLCAVPETRGTALSS